MTFSHYLKQQMELHPSMQPQDVVKLCYQSAFGAEHLLPDPAKAKAYFETEFQKVSAADIPLYEEISPDICRVNLSAWKKAGLPADWLFQMFLETATVSQNGEKTFLQYLEIVEQMLSKNSASFSIEEWIAYRSAYLKDGIHAVHHSESYRAAEQPAYRIIHKKFLRLLSILQEAAKLPKNDIKIIAIDGRAASGKTTLAENLSRILSADVIHMDDFFLPPALRTEERLTEAGGNIHYERFLEEVIPLLKKSQPFSYRIFDCSQMDYNGSQTISPTPFRIVEGAYSCHPLFGNYADLTVFSDISPEEQMQRIQKRNGAEMAELFRTRWIPMEETYYAHFQIREKADIIL